MRLFQQCRPEVEAESWSLERHPQHLSLKEVQHAQLLLGKDDSADKRRCLSDRIHRKLSALVMSDHTVSRLSSQLPLDLQNPNLVGQR